MAIKACCRLCVVSLTNNIEILNMDTPRIMINKMAGSLRAKVLFIPNSNPETAVSQVGKGGFS